MTYASWRRAPRAICVLAGLSFVAGCSDEPYKAPVFSFLPGYKSAQKSAPVLLSNTGWWKAFDDPTLNTLIEAALAGNLDLDIAKERVVEAAAIQRSVPQAALLSPSVRAGRERNSLGQTDTTASGTLGFEWILDIYGGRRAQIDAAGARIEVADAEVDAACLLLMLNVANTYVDLRFHQTSLQLRHTELASRRKTLDLVQRLREGNAAIEVDVVKARALVSETRAEIPQIIASIEAAKNEIAVLLGKMPGALKISLDGSARQPRVAMSPEVGIPADLLRNRPDIRVAERSYYAAFRDVAGARADLYPRLSLSGTITSTSLSGANNPEYFFGPALTLPVLPNTARRASVEQRQSLVRQAHTEWQQTVLEAIGDVETSLASYKAALASQRASEETVRLYREVVTLTRQLVAGDGATVRDLIEAEQDVSAANTSLANTLRRVGQSFVELNVNLGSGHAVGRAVAVVKE
ncbi:efflux transporter outer membrane subunit [Roseovarius sp. S1116L3]|uniref:efflux transporter outer membrane subunit n=1 Tax=Roseovarius roseus TaxID=3342636 RepID=UPI00372C88A7